MASNSFGTRFRITTWGESHGKAIGAVIDGCPAGLPLTNDDINVELEKRRPGKPGTSPRKEPDIAEIYSGVFEGKTTGAPISIIIFNRDANSRPYEATKDLMRPGHANYTYLKKYGIFDYRGGGRASARETACRVAAGAVAKKLLALYDITVEAALEEQPMPEEGDSIGGIVTVTTSPLPVGLGDPLFEKLEANLAKAILSIPATKGFEIGEGFAASAMSGSSHNDLFDSSGPTTNRSGGTLGGISTGQPLRLKVAFKPTSSIRKPQQTVTTDGLPATLTLPKGSRHDPCVAIRGVIVVEAMVALVLIDALLLGAADRIDQMPQQAHEVGAQTDSCPMPLCLRPHLRPPCLV